VVEVSGRLYPVEVLHEPLESSLDAGEPGTYVDAAVRAVANIVEISDPGDILVFMPTERDIRETVDRLRSRSSAPWTARDGSRGSDGGWPSFLWIRISRG
jgi:ATP-dependent helicase HrpA